jgi:glycerol-3-phosphate O-acyltransferase/dihydroxyacetone phosphate acyltransferase
MPRQRKASLSDGVPVERIAAVDPSEQFDDATQGLNDEISIKKRKKILA